MAYSNPTVVASGTAFAAFQSGGASGHLELLIAAQGATAKPTAAPTATATGGGSTGGALAAGTYYFVHTESNGFGETLQSPEGVQLTVSATNQPQFTFPTLKTGNVSRNLYLGAVGGSTGGPYYLYATGITTSTYTAAVAVPANSYAVNPPTVNTTGLTSTNATTGVVENKALALLRGAKDGNLEDTYTYLRDAIAQFNSGQPVTFNGEMMKLRHAHVVFAMLSTLCAEMGTLIDANAGTLSLTTNTIGNTKTHRTWP